MKPLAVAANFTHVEHVKRLLAWVASWRIWNDAKHDDLDTY
jgi:hypothetical protein